MNFRAFIVLPLGWLLVLTTEDVGAKEGANPTETYLKSIINPRSGSQVIRITGDPGTPIGGLDAHWAGMARHRYSKVSA